MAVAQKEGLLLKPEQARAREQTDSAPIVADRTIGGKGVGECGRCGRKLTNPHSIARGLGPICYKRSGGGIFDSDMMASEEEWADRAEDLRRGG